MKKTILAVTLPLLAAWSSLCISAETCYTVKGKVKTVNISESIQSGLINLKLFDNDDNKVFSKTGNIEGRITGPYEYGLYLSHSAAFGEGEENWFVTIDDEAVITGIRKSSKDESPCSFFVREVITNIDSGAGFFAEVNDVEIVAEGYINTCPGKNKNKFKLTGYLCVD